jgi:hypothetical protein
MTTPKPELSADELLSEAATLLPERQLMRHRRRAVSQSNRASNTIAQLGGANSASLTSVQANVALPGHGSVSQSNSAENTIFQVGDANTASLTNVQANVA